jgi:hypothetical protein
MITKVGDKTCPVIRVQVGSLSSRANANIWHCINCSLLVPYKKGTCHELYKIGTQGPMCRKPW